MKQVIFSHIYQQSSTDTGIRPLKLLAVIVAQKDRESYWLAGKQETGPASDLNLQFGAYTVIDEHLTYAIVETVVPISGSLRLGNSTADGAGTFEIQTLTTLINQQVVDIAMESVYNWIRDAPTIPETITLGSGPGE